MCYTFEDIRETSLVTLSFSICFGCIASNTSDSTQDVYCSWNMVNLLVGTLCGTARQIHTFNDSPLWQIIRSRRFIAEPAAEMTVLWDAGKSCISQNKWGLEAVYKCILNDSFWLPNTELNVLIRVSVHAAAVSSYSCNHCCFCGVCEAYIEKSPKGD